MKYWGVFFLWIIVGLLGSIDAKSVISPSVVQIDSDALVIRDNYLYLRNSLNEDGVSVSVGVNHLVSTINSTMTTHESLSTMGVSKAYIDYVISKFRAETDALFYKKVYGGDMIGTIIFSGSIPSRNGVASTKWLLCDGSTVLTADYPELFAILGTRFGGNGTTTFGLPNMEKRMVFGAGTVGSDSFLVSSGTGGAETKTLSISEMPSHTHAITDPGHKHNVNIDSRNNLDHVGNGSFDNEDLQVHDNGSGTNLYTSGSSVSNITINNNGSGTAYSQMQPYRVIKAFIRVLR